MESFFDKIAFLGQFPQSVAALGVILAVETQHLAREHKEPAKSFQYASFGFRQQSVLPVDEGGTDSPFTIPELDEVRSHRVLTRTCYALRFARGPAISLSSAHS